MRSSESVFPGEEFHARWPVCVSKPKLHPKMYFAQQACGQAQPTWLLLGVTGPSIRHTRVQKAVSLHFLWLLETPLKVHSVSA